MPERPTRKIKVQSLNAKRQLTCEEILREPWRFWNHSEQDTNGTLFLRIVFNADNLNILPYRQRAMNTRTQMFFCEDRKAWCEHEMKDPPWHANHEKYSFKSAACVMPFVPHVFQLILKSKQIFRAPKHKAPPSQENKHQPFGSSEC